jgi:8-oxoguanine deaminase
MFQSFDAGGHVVLPGLINTHHHFFQTSTRAAPAALDRALFGWLGALYPLWARVTPEALEAAATVAFAELLLSGCTTAADHHYVFPPGSRERDRYRGRGRSPTRATGGVDARSMNRSQRDGGLPPVDVVQDEETILADSERVIAAYHQTADGAMVQIALAPCSPFSVTTSLMRETAALSERTNVRLHAHRGNRRRRRLLPGDLQLPAARLS